MRRKIILVSLLLAALTFNGCTPEVSQKVGFPTEQLPSELRDIKVYKLSNGWNDLLVAVVPGQESSTGTAWQEGKYTKYAVTVKVGDRTIRAEEVLAETDEVIVLRKKRNE